ncbi:MAG: tetratricopeptide repeat protein [Candidatus Latescibacterota bacterium]|nr:MAG: tetratricopeptide repeat protein [Candidatus Latescibacterota bacterium]
MLSSSKIRGVLVAGVTLVVMVIVFIAMYDWGSGESTVAPNLAVRTAMNSTPTTTAPPPVIVATQESSEGEDTTASVPEPPKEVTYEEAEAAFHEKRYDMAVELFTRYTNRKSENPWGYYMLGLSAWKAGDNDRAVEALTHALELDPHHVKSYLNLGRVYLEMGKPMDALDKIRAALEIDPESNVAYRLKGRVFREIRQRPQAIESYQRAIQIDNQDAWSMNNLGLVYIEQELFDKALPPLARAAELQPDNAVFLNNLGMALECTGHFRAAEETYQLAVEIDESYEKASANLERVAAVLEDPDLEPVDLAVVAQSFVDEIESWGDAVVAGKQPDSVDAVVVTQQPDETEPKTTPVVSDADSTKNGDEQ